MRDEMGRLIIDDTVYSTEIPENSRKEYEGLSDPSEIRAFIPGTIVDINVSSGEMVQPGAVLLLLDAMKMHNEICSRVNGRIEKIHVSTGESVQKDQLLISIITD